MIKAVFQNQVVIITGASAGIGHELAIQLAAHRACLVLLRANVLLREPT
ncbi:MAG: hypothetical protein U0670_23365 [Anaerolineae bacterium]